MASSCAKALCGSSKRVRIFAKSRWASRCTSTQLEVRGTYSARFNRATADVVLPKLAWSSADLINASRVRRSEEHTSELQSRFDLVCRLLLEKKKRQTDADLRAAGSEQ